MLTKLFDLFIVFAIATTINIADLENGSDIYAKGEDSINASELILVDGEEETVITEFPFLLNELEEKEYTLKSGENTYKLHIDNTAPEIKISKGDGTYKEAEIKVQISDAEKTSIKLDGKDSEPEFKLDKNGTYKLVVTAEDKAGNTSKEERTYKIYNSNPVIKISGVDKEVQNTDYNIKVEVTSELDVTTVVTLDGENKSENFTVSEEGSHTLVVKAIDELGNESTETKTFEIDKTAPEITINGIDKASYNTEVNYVVSGADKVTLNGKEVSSEGTVTEDGNYKLVATAEDSAGNITTETKEFKIKTSAPEIEIKGIDKEYFNSDVNYSVTSDGDLTITLNGSESAVSGTLKDEGTYTLTVTAEDDAGNSATVTKKFEIDKTDPVITVSGIADGFYNKDINYAITSTDDLEVSLDGKELNSSGVINTEGHHILTITSTDKAGNKAAKQIVFTLDKTAPKIEFNNLTHVNDLKKVLATVDDANFDSVTMSATHSDKTLTSESKEAKIGLDKDDPDKAENDIWEFEVTATDKSGNTTTVKKSIVKDTIAPKISLPKLAGHINTDVNMVADISDPNEEESVMTISRDGVERTVSGKGKITEPLTMEGSYKVTVNSIDKAGNKSEDFVSFIIDKTAPVVTIESSRGHIQKAETIKLSSNEPGDTFMTITLDGKQIFSGKTASFSKLETNGVYNVSAYSVDLAGNKSATKKASFTVDNVAPKVSLTGIKEGTYSNKPVTLTASVNERFYEGTKVDVSGHIENKNGISIPFKCTGPSTKVSKTFSTDGTYHIRMTATDAAGNTASTKELSFVIDQVAPVVSIDASSGHVKSAKTVKLSSNEPGSTYMTVKLDGRQVYSGKTASFSDLSRNGIYEISAYSVDLAGNKSAVKKTTFTVDNTAPKVSLSGIKEGSFSNKPVTITATVNERFYEGTKVDVSGYIEKGSKVSIPFKCTGTKTSVSKSFSENGVYHIKMTATDKAGNTASTKELTFTVDTKNPTIDIAVPSEGRYDSIIAPVVTIKDDFFQSRDISLSKGTDITYRDSFGNTGGTRTYANFKKLKENDGIYTITARATDKAGNSTTVSKTFTVNRFGSTFKTKKKPDDYSKAVKSDIVIEETNVSGIESFKCEIFKDAEKYEAEGVKVKTNGDVSTYTIPASNFDKEGVYKVYLVTQDKSGNTSKSEGEFTFTVDKTPPVITYTGVESNRLYKQESVKMYVSATDSLTKEPNIKVTVDGLPATIDKDDQGQFVMLRSGYNHKIKIVSTDKAGNSSNLSLERVSISTSKFSVFATHKLLTGALIALLAAAGGLGAIFAAKKRKEDKGDDMVV